MQSRALRGGIFLLIIALLTACSTPSGQVPVTDKSLTKGASAAQLGSYKVKKGDTLYSIAMAYDLDYRAIAKANNIGSDFAIFPGQTLTLSPSTLSSSNSPQLIVVRSASLPKKTSQESTKNPSTTSSLSKKKVLVGQNSAHVKPTTTNVKKSSTTTAKNTAKSVAKTPSNQSGEVKWQWPSTGSLIKGFSTKGDINKGINLAGNRGDPVFAAADGEVVFVGGGLPGYGNLVIIEHNLRYLSAYAHNSRLLVKEKAKVSAGQKIAEMGRSDATRVMLHFEIRRDGIPVNPLKYLPIKK